MSMWMTVMLAAVLAVCMLVPVNHTEVTQVHVHEYVPTYGPGHETHEYACWDNGDGTHTVACDCGIEKRIEPHFDNDSDGVCEACGMEY